MVGPSDGSGFDPGEIDFTALPAVQPIGVMLPMRRPLSPPTCSGLFWSGYLADLVPFSAPVTNSTWQVHAQGIAASTFGVYIVGLGEQMIPLASFGSLLLIRSLARILAIHRVGSAE